MHCVTTVDPHWLAEMGSMFFSVKQTTKTRKLKSQIEKEEKEKMRKSLLVTEESRASKSGNGGGMFNSMVFERPASSVVYMGGRATTPAYKTPKF